MTTVAVDHYWSGKTSCGGRQIKTLWISKVLVYRTEKKKTLKFIKRMACGTSQYSMQLNPAELHCFFCDSVG